MTGGQPGSSDLPMVSVLIPTYTMERWLGLAKTVAAVREQSMPAANVVVDHNATGVTESQDCERPDH